MKSVRGCSIDERRRLIPDRSIVSWCVLLGMSLALAGCPSSQVRQAEHLVSEGRLDDAVELYRKSSRQDPFNERLQEQLAEAPPYATPGAADRIPSVANSLNVDLLSRPSNSAYGILENHRFIGQMPLGRKLFAHTLAVSSVRINVRRMLNPGNAGNFADGVIGATAIERGSILVTNDFRLLNAVNELGGRAARP